MREHETEIHEAGASIAAIGLGDATYAKHFRDETGITFPLLIDEERVTYKAADLNKANAMHLLRRDNFKYRKQAKSEGHDQHKLGQDPFQLGGTFIFAPGNQDVYAHVSETFGDTASLSEVLGSLRTLD